MMAFVFKSKRRVNGKVRSARTWSGQYRLPGDLKPIRVALGVTDKQVAKEKLSRIVRDAEREREGLSLPKKQRDAAMRSVERYVHEFVESRRGLNRDEKYVRELERKLLRLIRECKWPTLGDIAAHSFEAWRARQRQDGMSPKTLNEYHAAAFGLCKWLEPRIGSNPMRTVERIKALGDPDRIRRALTPAELWRLVSVAGERAIVYLVAAFTGLRRGELGKIEWRDVHIDEAQPYISVRCSIAKNAKLVRQPLPPRIAAALRQCRLVNVAPTDLVFKRLIPRMNRFRDDLTAAGIPYIDAKSEYADFHGLRTTFGTELAKSRLPVRVAMELLRHSDVKLTTKIYTDAGMLPIWDAVEALPMFNDTQIDTLKLVEKGQSESAAVPLKNQGPILLAAGGQSVSPSESAPVGESPQMADGARCRVRTCDFLRVKQALYH
jgi:integrase